MQQASKSRLRFETIQEEEEASQSEDEMGVGKQKKPSKAGKRRDRKKKSDAALRAVIDNVSSVLT
jgi:hypothetical protein